MTPITVNRHMKEDLLHTTNLNFQAKCISQISSNQVEYGPYSAERIDIRC